MENTHPDMTWLANPQKITNTSFLEPKHLEFPEVTFETNEVDYITAKEVNEFYNTIQPGPFFGPRMFLMLLDKLSLKHHGNFPIPGWHAWMHTSRFLEKCAWVFQHEDGFKEWEQAMTPKNGVCTRTTTSGDKKALLMEQEQEQRRPKKIRYKELKGTDLLSRTTSNLSPDTMVIKMPPYPCITRPTPSLNPLAQSMVIECDSQEDDMDIH